MYMIVCDLCAGRLPFGEVLVAPVSLYVCAFFLGASVICVRTGCLSGKCWWHTWASVGVCFRPTNGRIGSEEVVLGREASDGVAPGLPYLMMTIRNLLVHLLLVNSC